MFYPLPIAVYILEIACVAVFLRKRTPMVRALIATLLVVMSAALFQWLIWND